MRILCINRKYDGVVGGVEKMSISLMNEMVSRGHDCALLSLDQKDASSFYKMEAGLSWFKIDIGNADVRAGFSTKLKRFIEIRRCIRKYKPDVIIGFQDGAFLLGLYGSIGLRIPLVAAERNALERFDYLNNGSKRKKYICNLYRFAKAITVQCPSYTDRYPEFLRQKIHVIGNPVFIDQNLKPNMTVKKPETKIILSVGRLCYQKNILTLVKAFELLRPNYQDWKLVIIGDGEDKNTLQNYINDMELSHHIEIKSFTKDVSQYYLNSDIFCIPSLWEGFPNVLAEAQSYALPSVGFKACAGVRDLIVHEKNGILSDENAPLGLSLALQKLMDNPNLRIDLGQCASETIKQYSSDVIFNKWEDFFKRFDKDKI